MVATISSVNTEPRGTTIADFLVITLGFAVAWSMGVLAFGGDIPVGYLLTYSVACVPIAVATAIVARQSRYRRRIHRAEYVTFVCAAALISWHLPSVDTAIEWIHNELLGRYETQFERWTIWRWSLAGIITAFALLVVVLDWTRFPRLLTAAIMAVVFTAVYWGPVQVFANHLDFPLILPMKPPLSVIEAAWLELQSALRHLPLVLCWVVPLELLLHSYFRDRRRWGWTCWFSLAVGVMAVFCILGAGLFAMSELTGNWRIAWIARPIWLGVVVYVTNKAIVTVAMT